MIEEYKYVNGKIVALDNQTGIKVYDCQDNINDILKQENVVESINDNLSTFNDQKDCMLKYKDSFYHMIFNEKYGAKSVALLFLSFLSGSFILLAGPVMQIVLSILGGICLFSFVVSLIYEYKKYKKDMLVNIENIEQQIKEFENILEKEKSKLNELKKNKANGNKNYIEDSAIKIDNNSNTIIKSIQNKKLLYEFFRDNCNKIKKYSNKGDLSSLFSDDYTEEDIASIRKMYENNKKLVKNKKHN